MSRIVIIGGHGKVALLAAPLLRESGHEVVSVIRNPDHAADVEAAGAQPVVADVETLDAPGIGEVIADADVVVWSAGAGGGDEKRTYAVDRDAAIRSMQAAMESGVQRYVMVSYFGAGPDHGVPQDSSFYAYAQAKAAADEHLKGTDLDWTILQPSTLTLDEPTGRIEVSDGSLAAGKVSRGNVAAVVAAVVDRPSTVRAVIEFNDGDTPIADALP